MRIVTIVGIAILGTSMALTVRPVRPELSMVIGIVTGFAILLGALDELTGLVETVRSMAETYGISASYLGVLLKIIGIAYIAHFGVQLCRDAGEGASAAKVELAGRVLILSAALPSAVSLLSAAAELIGRATP